VAALLLSATALLVYEFQTSRHAGVSDLRSQADLIAQSLLPALVFDDKKAASDALAAFKLRPQIDMAVVFDANGKLFSSYQSLASTQRGEQIPTAHGEEALEFGASTMALTRRAAQNGELLGTIYLRANHNLLGRIFDYFLILSVAGAAAVGLSALIFRKLHPRITSPILAMADVAQRIIDDHNYGLRVVATSDDEVGVLVTAFNNMLDALSTQMKEREDAEAALRNADRMKDQFLATLAHELRNPLAPLTTGLALLKRNDSDPQMRTRMRELMERQLKQMVRLIDDLLEVSRITRGKFELRRHVITLTSVARQAVEACESTLASKHHTLVVHIPEQALWVNADAARLIQVVVNLLNNAGRYTPPNGRIELSVKDSGDQVAIEVADNGIGIDPTQQQAVFDMFVQVDDSLERGAAGLGIGLTIARELVRLHGGTLSLASAGLGQGTTFTVALPKVNAPAATSEVATSGEAQPPLERMTIVVADDNVDFAESFAEMLRLHQHSVVVAHDGRSALLTVESVRPQVAFLDIGMPGLNGLDVATSIRANLETQNTVLVAITGWGQQADRQRVKEAGFDHHLVKPVDFENALALLVAVARQSRGAAG
jgi:signal transduction histidine kinase/CheY-like chemotaxis protein